MFYSMLIKNSADYWNVYNPINLISQAFRLDEEMDTGGTMFESSDKEPLPQMSMAFLTSRDTSEGFIKSVPYFVFDNVEQRGESYFIHELTLVEPTRRLMGVIIDGMTVTQPPEEEGTQATKKSLYDVAELLLKKCNLKKKNGSTEFQLPSEDDPDDDTVSILQNVESPEFQWTSGTTLYEALRDIGYVINRIPRLGSNNVPNVGADNGQTNFNVVFFDAVN